jgi:hypothetical protein
VDQARFEELEHKRDTAGLTDEEANELGRMIAEREGRPYSNRDDERSARRDQEETEIRDAETAEEVTREREIDPWNAEPEKAQEPWEDPRPSDR